MSDGMYEGYRAAEDHKARVAKARSERKGLHFDCPVCELPIERPGGLLISPPDENGVCYKAHVCADCWPMFAHRVRLPIK